MHILKIIHGYPPHYSAGSEVYTQSLCNELSKFHKVSVFTRREDPYTPCFRIDVEVKNQNLKLYFVNNPHHKEGFRHARLDKNFASLVAYLQPDIAHIGHLNYLSTGIVDILYQMNIPIVYTLHDFWLMCPRGQFLTRSIGKEENFQLCSGQDNYKCAVTCYEAYFSGYEERREQEIAYWSKWVEKRMRTTRSFIDKVDIFINPSRFLRNIFIEDFGVPESKIIYMDYGFPLDYLVPPKKNKEDELFTFGYIGTFIPAKDVNLLVEAFKQIQLPARLLLWGYKDEQSIRALREMARDSVNEIRFMGPYSNERIAYEVFSRIDCIVVPSIWAENSPLVIHEAQACHVPVITANYGGMKEYVQHMVNGLLFEHRNPRSLKEQMEFAINNPDLMEKLGKRGYLYSEDGTVPDIQSHCNNLERLYSQLIQSRTKSVSL